MKLNIVYFSFGKGPKGRRPSIKYLLLNANAKGALHWTVKRPNARQNANARQGEIWRLWRALAFWRSF